MIGLLVLLEIVLMGSHVFHGGLYTDDWQIASFEHFLGTGRLFDDVLLAANHDRPLGALYLASQAALSGTNTHVHALWGLVTHLLCTMSLYLLLRVLRMQARHAVPIAVLVLLFPFSDSVWLWASLIPLSIALAVLGAVLAIRGLECEGRPGVVYHLGALALFVASILTYQAAAVAICLLGVAYLSRAPTRRALRRWAADVVVVAIAAVLPRLITGSEGATANPIIPVDKQFEHARLLVDQGATLLTAVVVPFDSLQHRAIVSTVLALLVATALLAARARRTGANTRGELRRWLAWVFAGGVVVAAAYAVYVPSPVAFYQPLAGGSDNRVNALAGIGFVILVYALIMLAATLATAARRRPRAAPLVGLALAALLFSKYAHRVRTDAQAWDAAAQSQREQLAKLKAGGRPARRTTLYVFGGKGVTAPGVYGFRVTWDLRGAVQLLWDDPSLRAYPIFAGTAMDCGKSRVVPVGPGNGNGPAQASAYRQTLFVDLRTNRRAPVPNRQVCRSLQPTFVPGPVTGP